MSISENYVHSFSEKVKREWGWQAHLHLVRNNRARPERRTYLVCMYRVKIAEPEVDEQEEPARPAPKGRGRKAAATAKEPAEAPKKGRATKAKAEPKKAAGRGRKKAEPKPVEVEEVVDEEEEVAQPAVAADAQPSEETRPKTPQATTKGRRKTVRHG